MNQRFVEATGRTDLSRVVDARVCSRVPAGLIIGWDPMSTSGAVAFGVLIVAVVIDLVSLDLGICIHEVALHRSPSGFSPTNPIFFNLVSFLIAYRCRATPRKIEPVARRFGVHHPVRRRTIQDGRPSARKGSAMDPHREYPVRRLGEHPS
ncbi:MAG: hypothetical protein WDO69_33620 [Pseudomonadota bacterium]